MMISVPIFTHTPTCVISAVSKVERFIYLSICQDVELDEGSVPVAVRQVVKDVGFRRSRVKAVRSDALWGRKGISW